MNVFVEAADVWVRGSSQRVGTASDTYRSAKGVPKETVGGEKCDSG